MSARLSVPRLLPLTILVMLLLLTAKAVTLAGEAGAALDLTSAPSPAAPPVVHAPEAAPLRGMVKSEKQPVPRQVSDSERTLLEDLRKRREDLDARSHMLDERSSVIEASEAVLQAKIDHLSRLQDQVNQSDLARKNRRDANWSGLVKVYESMKPRDAATIFDVLDMHVLLEVVDRMKERKAAAILASMQPERARMATQMLAHMRVQQETILPQAAPEVKTNLNIH